MERCSSWCLIFISCKIQNVFLWKSFYVQKRFYIDRQSLQMALDMFVFPVNSGAIRLFMTGRSWMDSYNSHCCGLAGWSLFSVVYSYLCDSDSRWKSLPPHLAHCLWPTIPLHSSAFCTQVSPSHSWEHAPSRTGRGCWNRCKAQAHVPLLHTYFFQWSISL